MIPLEEAVRIVLENTRVLPKENVDFREATGRVLAEDVTSDTDLPPFPRSAVDGFALRTADLESLPCRLSIVGVVPAGSVPSFEIRRGEAAQIMTGAPVPEGADAVQMVERTRVTEGQVEVMETVASGQNIAPRGQEVRVGEIVIGKGVRLDPASVAVAATVGKVDLRVGSRPRVAVIATGDELVEPAVKPNPGQIRNSNGFALVAQARAMGARVSYLGVARDTEASLGELIGRGLGHDVLLISGGVSMGRFDLVEKVLAERGVRILFEAVALKPGKPLVAGVAEDGGMIFGLPGNPVSTMVTFELVVRPTLAKMEGCEQPQRPILSATLKHPLSSRGPRRAFLPGWIEPETTGLAAYPIPSRGSADIVAFAKANSLLIVPEDTENLAAGETVGVYPLDRFLFSESRWHAAHPS
ncbi:MAG TPA: gephyrin-like molybdotransferase Glp [Vicinamibacteria bacterium]|jgi:molybdopterin molybdotransferase